MVYAADFIHLLRRQIGDRYIYGHRVSLSDPDPDIFDCSELVEWACARLGVRPKMPDGARFQARHCKKHGQLVTVRSAERTPGALLFHFSSDPFTTAPAEAHVVVSLGNGRTAEARGHAWGVGSFKVAGRGWTHATHVPGLRYGTAPVSPPPLHGGKPLAPAWPGRFLMRPPDLKGADVKKWQTRMKARGWAVPTTGVYDAATEKVCIQFQKEKGLEVDGVVGPSTWEAAWLAAVTP